MVRYSRKTYYSRKKGLKMSPYEVAQHALALARKTRRLLNVEFKVKYTTQALISINTTPVFQCLTNMAQGTNDDERVGNNILAKSLNWRFYFSKVNGQNAVIRAIIFRDVAGQGATPGVTDLLQVQDVNSPLNLDNGKRFRVLKDYYDQLSNGGKTILLRKGGLKQINTHCEFDGTGSGVADTTNGHLWVMWMSNIAPAGDDPVCNSYITFRYIDN